MLIDRGQALDVVALHAREEHFAGALVVGYLSRPQLADALSGQGGDDAASVVRILFAIHKAVVA